MAITVIQGRSERKQNCSPGASGVGAGGGRRGPGDAVRRKPARRFSPLISLGFGVCTVAPVLALAWRRLVPASLSGDHPSVGHNSFLQCGFTPVFVLYVVTIGRAPPDRGPAANIARHSDLPLESLPKGHGAGLVFP